MMRTPAAVFLCGLALVGLLACGGSEETAESGGSTQLGKSGSSGKGGSGGKGGSSGKGGSGGGGGSSQGQGGSSQGEGGSSQGQGGSQQSTGGSSQGGSEQGGPEICGNGLDDDGNGQVDEKCPCEPGKTQVCYSGPPSSAGKGSCKKGQQTCSGSGEFSGWGACVGAVLPAKEKCDNGLDDDCNGQVDEVCSACTPTGPEVCDNGKDDNCDGSVDEGCGAPCVPSGPEICGNGKDDDCKGGVDDGCMPACVPSGPEICGNVKDDDCNGSVDETCECVPGQSESCEAGVGACSQGEKSCEQGAWGPCIGKKTPVPEICGNSQDDDCNGKPDDGCDPQIPPELKCDGQGLISDYLPDDCIHDGGKSAAGDELEVYCEDGIARFCLSKESCPWRSGKTTPKDVTCSTAGLTSEYLAKTKGGCSGYENHFFYCCSKSGQITFDHDCEP